MSVVSTMYDDFQNWFDMTSHENSPWIEFALQTLSRPASACPRGKYEAVRVLLQYLITTIFFVAIFSKDADLHQMCTIITHRPTVAIQDKKKKILYSF